MRATREYHIRLYRDDGTLSVVLACDASQDSIAAREALRLLNHELTRAHIWRDNELIRTFDYVDGLAVVS